MRYGTPADEERLLNEIRERAKNPARLDPRAERIAEGAISCEGKKAYRTPEFADVVAKAVTGRFGSTVVPYFCNFCSQYHLATKRTA